MRGCVDDSASMFLAQFRRVAESATAPWGEVLGSTVGGVTSSYRTNRRVALSHGRTGASPLHRPFWRAYAGGDEVHEDARHRQRLRVRRRLRRAAAGGPGRPRAQGQRPALRRRRGRADPHPPVRQGRRPHAHVQRRRQRGGDVRQRRPLRRQVRLRPRANEEQPAAAIETGPRRADACRSSRAEGREGQAASPWTWARRSSSCAEVPVEREKVVQGAREHEYRLSVRAG